MIRARLDPAGPLGRHPPQPHQLVVSFIRAIPKTLEVVQALTMRAGIVVNFTLDDRCRLEAIVGDRNAPQKHVWRAKIIHRFLPRVPAGQSRND
jgi:hypothetical protein